MSNTLLKQLKIAREFSPKGKLPDDFHKWFEIKPTVLAKKTMKGVFAVKKNTQKHDIRRTERKNARVW